MPVDHTKAVLQDIFCSSNEEPSFFDRLSLKKQMLSQETVRASFQPTTRNQLVILKEFASFTPSLGASRGGGFLLFLDGHGIVIDPGYNFVDNFRAQGFRISDVQAVIVTHAHDDHCISFEALTSLLFQEHKNRGRGERRVEFFLEQNAHSKYHAMFSSKRPFLHLNDPLKPRKTIHIPDAVDPICRVIPQRGKHNVFGKNSAFGLVFETRLGRIIFTGDTGWGKDIERRYAPYEECELLVLNIGSILEREKRFLEGQAMGRCLYKNHLGIIGACKFISLLEPKKVVVSELGEEFEGMVDQLTHIIEKHFKINCIAGNLIGHQIDL